MGLDLPKFMRNRFFEILKKTSYSAAKGAIVTHRVYTRTKDNSGRVTNVTTKDTAIDGYVHYITPNDAELLEQGWAQVGDAALFTKHNYTINIEDSIIDTESVEWEVMKLINRPIIQGLVTHQEFALKRRE